jgi:hypothetical protein
MEVVGQQASRPGRLITVFIRKYTKCTPDPVSSKFLSAAIENQISCSASRSIVTTLTELTRSSYRRQNKITKDLIRHVFVHWTGAVQSPDTVYMQTPNALLNCVKGVSSRTVLRTSVMALMHGQSWLCVGQPRDTN